jgi:hypothetical protein
MKPNFFIIGAPKCGTTSMAFWLSEHPYVFMAPIKEPRHFNTDFHFRETPDRNEYEKLFRKASKDHVVIGEASTHYLFSKEAIPNILEYSPDAKFIAMVRNPIDMVVSLHTELLYCGNENISNFEDAWKSQVKRKNGQRIPAGCSDREFLQYGETCRLGKQLSFFFNKVSINNRMVIILDQMKADPATEYKKVLKFLNIDDDKGRSFPIKNQSKKHRFNRLGMAIKWAGRVKRKLGFKYGGLGILDRFQEMNNIKKVRSTLSEDMRLELLNYFRKDILLMEKLLDSDFKKWMD